MILAVLAATAFFLPWTPVTERLWARRSVGAPTGEPVVGLELMSSPEGPECFWAWMMSLPVLCLGIDSTRGFALRARGQENHVDRAEAALPLLPRLGLALAAAYLGWRCLSSISRSEPWGAGLYLTVAAGVSLVLIDTIYAPASVGLALWERADRVR